MDTTQHEKRYIQKREQTAIAAFSLLLLIVFVITASLFVFLSTTRVVQTVAPLSGCLLFFLILGLGISQLGPYMQKTEQRKQHWLNEYGQQVHAVVSKHPYENALIIGERVRGRGAAFMRYLNWQDPQTAQHYSFCVSARFSSTLRNLSEGTLYPVQFDPDDPSFFVVPGK